MDHHHHTRIKRLNIICFSHQALFTRPETAVTAFKKSTAVILRTQTSNEQKD